MRPHQKKKKILCYLGERDILTQGGGEILKKKWFMWGTVYYNLKKILNGMAPSGSQVDTIIHVATLRQVLSI